MVFLWFSIDVHIHFSHVGRLLPAPPASADQQHPKDCGARGDGLVEENPGRRLMIG